jgi:hypothetical protein
VAAGKVMVVMLSGATTVTCAEADLVVSAWEMVVTVTAAGLGTVPGAVYKPEVETFPTVPLPPVTLLTCQVTAVFIAFCTVALNC